MNQATILTRKNPIVHSIKRPGKIITSSRKVTSAVISQTHRNAHKITTKAPTFIPQQTIPVLNNGSTCNYEIYAYCSKNYEDAYQFVIDSWVKPPNVSKVTIYTDWDLKSTNDKVVIKNMFEPSSNWIVGTGRRLDVIKHYSDEHRNNPVNTLFLDIDCYLMHDVSNVFSNNFDMAISRLFSGSDYTSGTATAGLWFTKMTPGYYNFIEDWFREAEILKNRNVGTVDHKISYVQYSFTKVARTQTPRYSVLPIDEKVYNSEHSDLNMWYNIIRQFNPKILHFKGRRFRDQAIINKVFDMYKRSKYRNENSI